MHRTLLAAFITLALSGAGLAQTLNGDRRLSSVSPQAATDPLKIIYRVPGIRSDAAGSNSGSATTFLCTNYSSTEEKFEIRIFKSGISNPTIFEFILPSRTAEVVSTKGTVAFSELILPIGELELAMAVIHSSTTNLHCSAMVHNAATAAPVGINLHMVRFNAHPGSVE